MTDHVVALPDLPGVTHQWLDVDGLHVHVAQAGSGPAVLLLHGFPQHWWQWRHLIGPLAAHHRVVCPDFRGAGWSGAPPGGYTRDRLLADTLAVLDALDLERVDLLSHDYGALVGYQLCLQHPQRVGRHLALSIPPPYFGFDARLVAAIARHAWFDMLLPLPLAGPRLLASERQWLPRQIFTDHSTPGALAPEDLEVFLAPLRDPARAHAAAALYRHFILPEAVRTMTGRYRGQRLRTPTLLLIGANDPVMRPDYLHGIHDHVDDLQLQVVPDASHFLADDQPDAVTAHALTLLATPS